MNEICDVMMDKSKYFYEFVKFRVGNQIHVFKAFINQHVKFQNDGSNVHIWPNNIVQGFFFKCFAPPSLQMTQSAP